MFSTLKTLSLTLIVFVATLAFGQGAGFTGVASVQAPGNLVRVLPNAAVVVCGYPGTGGTPCTNLATTYTSPTLVTPCLSTTPVIAPGTTTCSATADSAGNFQFFSALGNYVYYVQSGSNWKGPFVVTLAAPGSSTASFGLLNSPNGTSVNSLLFADSLNPGTVFSPASVGGGGSAFTGGALGVCISGAGVSGSCQVVTNGLVSLALDNAGVVGDNVCISQDNSSEGTDCGTGLPTSQVIGTAQGPLGGGLYSVLVNISGAGIAQLGTPNTFAGSQTMPGLTVNGTSFSNQSGNGADTNTCQVATDTSRLGTCFRMRNHAGNADLFMVDANGVVWAKNLLIDSTQPRFAIPLANGAAATTYKLLAKLVAGALAPCTTFDTTIPCWPVDTTLLFNGTTYCAPGTTGTNACVVRSGQAQCTFDAGGASDGDYVGESTASGQKCMTLGATLPAGPKWVIGRAVGTIAGNADGTVSVAAFGYPAASGSGALIYQEAGAGTTTNSASSVATNMFTGTTIGGGVLTAGHSLVVTATFKHSTNATSTTYAFSLGGQTVNFFTGTNGNTATVTFVIAATGTTQQYVTIYGFSPAGSTLAQIPASSFTVNLAAGNALNITQSAAGTTDVYTAYLLTVNLF